MQRLVGNLEVTHAVAVIAEDTEAAYFLNSFPTYALIDRKGIVRWKGMGDRPPASKIEELLMEGE